MSDQMIKYLQAFLPFLNGIHENLYSTAKPVLDEAEEGIFIIYTKTNVIDISSNTSGKKINIKKIIFQMNINFVLLKKNYYMILNLNII